MTRPKTYHSSLLTTKTKLHFNVLLFASPVSLFPQYIYIYWETGETVRAGDAHVRV